MNIAPSKNVDSLEYFHEHKAVIDDHPSIFTDIYQEDVNIVVWKRNLSAEVQTSVINLIENHDALQTSLIATPDDTYKKLIAAGGGLQDAGALCQDIAELVSMFCLLYELKKVGLRLTTLDRAMCPRFHVDKVPCRLVCTYHGVASEWLLHEKVDRSKLGRGNNGLSDDVSGLYQSEKDINQLNVGDVAMLKGELWQGNVGAGLVHRSPNVSKGEKRLLLTLDFQD